MGHYTKLKFSCSLKDNAPLDVLEKLSNGEMYKFITGEEHPPIMCVSDIPNIPINHPFGKTHRWDQIFNGATFNKKRKTLKIECDIKQYEEDYPKLVDWLKPFSWSGRAQVKHESMDYWIDIWN